MIDIIIPAYRGIAETRASIESVLAAANKTPSEIIVVNDDSPEPEITSYLATLATLGKITLLVNPANSGFVKSVNRGMLLHPDRDVLLLNSDTLVSNDWLDRMVRCAQSKNNIASVTPFSNNATICSYPKFCASNFIADGNNVAALDQIFGKTNAGKCLEMPTAIGFCMLIRRAVLNDVGLFDEAAFGRGYGEENDWCQRAQALGFKHLLCADTFVYHKGEVSFGESATIDKQRAQSIINERYPQYQQQIEKFITDDPARSLRRAVDVVRLSTSNKPRIVFITHHWGGGTERHVRELAKLVESDCEVLLLQPVYIGLLALTWLNAGEEFSAYFESATDIDALTVFLKGVGVSRVHMHHIHWHPKAILGLAKRLAVPLDLTVHDYFLISPRYFLGYGALVDEAQMELAAAQHPWGMSLAQWRESMHELLQSADRIICPSQDLATRIGHYLPGFNYLVWPHPDMAKEAIELIKVLILGGITKDKGLDVVMACAEDAKLRNLPLVYKIIGHTTLPIAQWPELPVMIHGSYSDDELATLIALEHADVFLFTSQFPETFSYTLSAAIRTTLPIVASRIGSLPERLLEYSAAKLIEWNAEATIWNDALLEMGRLHKAGKQSRALILGMLPETYKRQYLAPILATQPVLVNTVMPPARYFYTPRITLNQQAQSIEDLYINGIECGHRDSKIELKRRTHLADAELDGTQLAMQHAELERQQSEYNSSLLADLLNRTQLELQDTIQQAATQRETLEQERDAARLAYHNMESSTSWRMTEPLRNWMLRIQSLKQRSNDLRMGLKRLPRDASLASQILKEQGVVALGKRVGQKLLRQRDSAISPSHQYALENAITALQVNTSATPKFSIIIPVYEQHLLTFTCLKSIANTCADLSIEVIIVDDCSPTPASVALAAVEGIRIIRNDVNLGFLKNCNKAATIAVSQYLLILNNDTIVTDGWLTAMVNVFEQRSDAGMVGVKLIYPSGKLQEAGGIIWRDGSAWNVGRNDHADKPEFNFLRKVDYCSGACLLIPTALWKQLGGFDETYAPAYYEDTDLAFKIRAAGKNTYYQPRAVVVHFEGQSSGTDVNQGIKQHQIINQATFAKKWRETLKHHRVNGVQPHLEKERDARRRVLVIDACMLTPDQDSGSVRMFEILRGMTELGCKVTFVADNLDYRLPYVHDIQALGVEVLYHPFVSSITGLIEREAKLFDVIMLSRVTVACKYVDLVRLHAPSSKLVFDTVDLHFLRQQRQAELTADSSVQQAADNMRDLELDIAHKCDVTLVVSPVEQQLLESIAPRVRVGLLSNIHHCEPGDLPFAKRAGIIFIGGFRHPPNLDAIYWYVENVIPILRQKLPSVVTTIIGSEAPDALMKLASADIVVAGYVPDVVPNYSRARLSISPLRYGAGVKGKVNLSMQYGVPVIATSASVEGMHLRDGIDVMVADEPEAFADALVRAYTDEKLWLQLRSGGLANIDKYFSRNAARIALQGLLELTEG